MSFLLKIYILNLLPIVTGVLVTRRGKPYNVVLTAIHKIVSLAIVVSTVVMFFDYIKVVDLGVMGMVSAIITALCYLVVIGTGGKITHKEDGNEIIVLVHKGVTILLMVFLFLSIYLPID